MRIQSYNNTASHFINDKYQTNRQKNGLNSEPIIIPVITHFETDKKLL